jgi:hypothetical protein
VSTALVGSPQGVQIESTRDQVRMLLNAQATTFYVATTGNDANPGTLAQPFATLTAARNALAALPAEQKPGSSILVRGGTYAPPATQLNFSSSVSGTAEYPVIVSNYPGEYPVFSAMTEVTVPAGAAGVVSVTLPSSNTVHAVYSGDTRQHKARTPNYVAPNFSQLNPWQGNFARVSSDVTPNVVGANCPGRADSLNYCEVKYTVGTSDGELPDPTSWASLTGVKMLIFTGGDTTGTVWRSDEIAIESIDTGTQTIRLSGSAGYQLRAGHLFNISGPTEELDAAGEWLQDGTTLNYFRPTISEPLTLSILNTTNYQPYVISGSHMVFRGLTFKGFAVDPGGASSWMVRVSGGSNIIIDGWEVSKNITSGVLITDSSTNVTVKNSRFFDLESQAVNVPLVQSQMKAFTSAGIVIENNKIWNIGLTGKGVHLGAISANAPGTVVRNNQISDTARAGITGGASPNIVVENNVVQRTSLLTADSGAVSFVPIWDTSNNRSWLPQGHIISNNYINDTGGYSWDGSAMKFGHYTWGIYLDDFTSGSQIKRNIIKDFSIDCVMNHGGRDNQWENNICYTTRTSTSLARFREDPQSEGYGNTDYKYTEVQNMNSLGFNTAAYQAAFPNLSLVLEAPTASQIQVNNTFKKNILVSTASPAPRYFDGIRFNTNNVLSDNVIKTTGTDVVVSASINTGGAATYSSMSAWQAQGFDTNSVFADPLFVDANAGNFTVQSASPALSRGFQQINQSLYDVKNVLGEPPVVPVVGDPLVGSDVSINWSIPPLGTYPIIVSEYQVRQGSSSGSPVTSWVNVTGQGSTTLTSTVLTSQGEYTFCVRYTTDIRQPLTGATGATSPEGCRTFNVVSPPGTATPTPSGTSSASSSPSSTPSSTATKKTTTKQSPKATGAQATSTPTTQTEITSPSPSTTQESPITAKVSPSLRPSSSPFATTEPFTAEKSGSEGVVRNIFLAGIVVTLLSLLGTGIRWMLALRFLHGKPV